MAHRAAQAFNDKAPADVEQSVFGAEGRQGLKLGLQAIDGDRNRHPRIRRRRTQHGPAQDAHVGGLDRGGVKTADEQFAGSPGHGQVVRLQPDPVLVSNGQAPDGEVMPDVAAQSFDLQLADPPQAQAAGLSLQ